mmetsp:Transcript_21803/g.85364  ORF Transcript_21803/g.85364 Transcript_21803/m.85364 type:complete len:361 (+) Transcript_21803:556-1638(+)
MGGGQVGQRHRLVDRRAERAAGDDADLGAVGGDDLGALAHRHALLANEADALARRPVRELGVDDGRAGVATGTGATGAAHLLDRPGDARLDRRGGGVDVVAVQAQAGFQAQRIARAQADGLDLGVCQQLAGQGDGVVRVNGDFEAVFAGVAGAGQEGVDAIEAEEAAGHEGQLCDLGVQARQHGHRLGALQCQQRALRHGDDLAETRQMLLQMGDVLVLAAGVHHHEQVIGPLADHQVVEQAALVVREQGVALLEDAEVDDVHRHQRLQRGGGIGAHQAHLAHVRHIEQAGGRPRVLVLGHHAGGVLHRHVIAGEGHHLGAEFDMEGVKRRVQQRGHRSLRWVGWMSSLSRVLERLTSGW